MGLKEFTNSAVCITLDTAVKGLVFFGVACLSNFATTGYWNPMKQIEYFKVEREMEEQRKNRFDELHKEFVGYADRDKNGYIDFVEQVNAWRRAGYEGPFFESEGASQFPEPTLEGLEKAVVSYKNE